MSEPVLAVRSDLPAGWDELVPSPSLNRRWTNLALDRLPGPPMVFELSLRGVPSVYLLGAVATVPMSRPRVDPYNILSGRAASLGLAPQGPWPWQNLPQRELYPTLLLMNPNWETAAVGPGSDDPDNVRLLLTRIGDWRRKEGIRSVAALYVTNQPALLHALRAAGTSPVPLADQCVLDVTWSDFDGYVETLPARRRMEVRREVRALAGRVTVRKLGPDEETDQIVALRCQLVGKYGGRPDPAKERRFLDRVRREFGADNVTVFAAELAGRLLSFTLLVQDGPVWTALLTGSDYTRPEARLSYFATSFYSPAAEAPRRRVTTLNFGFGSWEAKARRGCRLLPTYAAATVPSGGAVL